MIEAIILDIGGVLTNRRGKTFAKEFSSLYGLEKDYVKQVFDECFKDTYELGKIGTDQYLTDFIDKIDVDIEKDELSKILKSCNVVDQEVYSIVKELHKKYKLAILSNSLPIFTEDLYEKIDMGLFDVIVFSDKVGMKKPNQDIYLHTLNELGLSADKCLFMDDNKKNIEVGEELGIKGILYKGVEDFERL